MSNSKAELLRVQLRWMNECDLDRVYELEQEFSPKPWGPLEFAHMLMHSNCVGMVVEHDSQIIGYVIYEMLENSIKISNICVMPKFRRKGVGSQMIARIAFALPHSTRKEITLAVHESNLIAQLFFRSLGFKAVNICRAEDMKEDIYVMRYSHQPRILPTSLILN